MSEDWIELPFGRPGDGFRVHELVDHIRRTGRDHIIQGQTKCSFSDHPKKDSLDYWLREHYTTRRDTMQAVNVVIEALVRTGWFEEGKFEYSTGRRCKGIRLLARKC